MRLTPELYTSALQQLAERDADFARILSLYGPPPIWEREPGFPTLVHIILEQQVSLASAYAAFRKLLAKVNPLTPQAFLQLDDGTLKAIGFSRQKSSYVRGLAQALLNGEIDLETLESMPAEEARSELLKIKGIGRWTADIYLLMGLLHADIFPSGDLALAKAVQKVKRLPEIPDGRTLEVLAEGWKPWRAVAARLFWHDYLSSTD